MRYMLLKTATWNKTYFVYNFLRNIIFDIRCNIIVNPSVQFYSVFGLGPQTLLNTVVNNTAYEGGFDGESMKITSRYDSISFYENIACEYRDSAPSLLFSECTNRTTPIIQSEVSSINKFDTKRFNQTACQ